jgi:antibiotic biosynthesis monooxygenase (ABM) superfamily enzyme
VITWLAIFPLVAIGMTILSPLTESWHPALRSLVLTLLVVPAAVYFVVPKLFAGYGSLKRRQAKRAASKA